MAWIVRVGTGSAYYLTTAERENNAWEMYAFFRSLSNPWDISALAALAGNMDVESTFNPGITNTSGYVGLTQYGGTRRTTFQSWMTSQGYSTWTDGNGQCEYLEYSRTHNSATEAWYGRGGYTNSFSDFAYNTQSWGIYDLCDMFQYCFERVDIGNPNATRRSRTAKYYQMFTGEEPPGPGPTPGPGSLPIWMLRKRRWWFNGGRRYI